MPEVLRTLGRYDIVREIGRGGMAIVYLARQTDLDRVVALKELAAFHAADPAFAERFVRESRIAGSLSHPNIVTVHDFLEHEGTPYIAMEYVEGGSLRPLVRDLELAQIAGVLECILAGLAHAESRGIVHRDLKPENVMVTADGSVKIADFGIAKALNQAATSHLSATGTAMGTPAYMAPEQALAKEIGPWTDLYSTGVIAYELLVGRLPFDERETPMAVLVKQIQEPIPPPRSLKPDLDERLARWLERMLEKDPALRPRGAAEAWDELEEIVITLLGPRWRREARLIGPLSANGAVALATTPEAAAAPDSRDIATRLDSTAAPPPVRPTPPTTPVRPEPSRSRRRALLAGLAVLLVLAGIVLAVVLVGSGDPEATTRPTTATTAPTTTAPAPLPPIVEDIVFERQGDQVKSTIQTSGPELAGATIRVPDAAIADGKATFELRKPDIDTRIARESGNGVTIAVADKTDRAVFTVTAAPGAFSKMSTPAINGARTVVVSFTDTPAPPPPPPVVTQPPPPRHRRRLHHPHRPHLRRTTEPEIG